MQSREKRKAVVCATAKFKNEIDEISFQIIQNDLI